MLCEKCHENEGIIEVVNVINGFKTKMIICEECAKSNVVENSPSTNNFLTELIDSIQNNALKVNYVKTTACRHCGMTYKAFKDSGRLGCPQCYGAFTEKLLKVIESYHGALSHEGIVELRQVENQELRKEIKRLKNELQESVNLEAYEKAAELRDLIKEKELMVLGSTNDEK